MHKRIRPSITPHDELRGQGLVCRAYELQQLQGLHRTYLALFVHSQYQKRDLIDFAGVDADRVLIVPHGPYDYGPPSASKDELRRRYAIPLDKQVALFFGDIRPDKNLDLFLKAMVPCKDRLFLIIAGRVKGGKKNGHTYWTSYIEKLGLSRSVRLEFEYIAEEKVADYFELCDWVAMPYSSRFTSQSGVLNVAMAHRRPVLITATPTIREILERCPVGVVAMPDDLTSLRAGIEQFLANGTAVFADKIDEYVTRFTWAGNAAITSQAYQKALS
ncbi:MAG: glycosyltransferase [Thermogutta sp.]